MLPARDYFAHAPGAGFGRVGLGLDPSDAAALAGVNPDDIQGGATALQQQGQQLYTQANQIAGAASNVVNGDLPSVTTATNLISNNFTLANAQQVITSAAAMSKASGGTVTPQDPSLLNQLLVAYGVLAAAVSLVYPPLGAAIAAMSAIVKGILSSGWAASGPITPTPGVVTALMAVPLPTDTSASSASSPYPIANALQTAPTGCAAAPSISGSSGPTVGGALAAWRDFLDQAANTNQSQPTTQRGNNGYPQPGNTAPNGFSLGCATWQACADNQGACLASLPNAQAALALAVRWVPFGDPWVAPYQDGFLALGSGANGTAYYLERQFVDLAWAYAAWPKNLADQQALAYVTALAWIWSNYPGAPAGPLPGWIAFKLGHLRALVSSAGVQATTSPTMTAADTTAAAGAGLVSALVAAPTLYALATRQPVRAVWGKLVGRVGVTRLPRLPRLGR